MAPRRVRKSIEARPSPSLRSRRAKSLVVIAHDGGAGTNARNVEGKDHGHADRRNGAGGHAGRRARFGEGGCLTFWKPLKRRRGPASSSERRASEPWSLSRSGWCPQSPASRVQGTDAGRSARAGREPSHADRENRTEENEKTRASRPGFFGYVKQAVGN